MYEEKFSTRLAHLRMQKGVSARDMSLSLGQNVNYINNIENGKAMPSMTAFFYICEYLRITPMEFFDFETADPHRSDALAERFKRLSPAQAEAFIALMDSFITHK